MIHIVYISFFNLLILLPKHKLIKIPPSPIETSITQQETHQWIIYQVIKDTSNRQRSQPTHIIIIFTISVEDNTSFDEFASSCILQAPRNIPYPRKIRCNTNSSKCTGVIRGDRPHARRSRLASLCLSSYREIYGSRGIFIGWCCRSRAGRSRPG